MTNLVSEYNDEHDEQELPKGDSEFPVVSIRFESIIKESQYQLCVFIFRVSISRKQDEGYHREADAVEDQHDNRPYDIASMLWSTTYHSPRRDESQAVDVRIDEEISLVVDLDRTVEHFQYFDAYSRISDESDDHEGENVLSQRLLS